MTTQSGERSPERRPSDLVRSVSRALTLLEVIGAHGAPISAKALARRTGLNLSTVYHLLRTLTWEGYLVRLPTGDYRLGAGVARRYRDLVASLGVPPPLRAILGRLVAQTGLTAYLGGTVDGHPAIIDVADGTIAPHVDNLTPGGDDALLRTPLAHLLPGGPQAGTTASPAISRVVVEDGRLQDDVSCAAVVARQPLVASRPGMAGVTTIWGIGLAGPLGWFSQTPAALRALAQAGEQLAGLSREGLSREGR